MPPEAAAGSPSGAHEDLRSCPFAVRAMGRGDLENPRATDRISWSQVFSATTIARSRDCGAEPAEPAPEKERIHGADGYLSKGGSGVSNYSSMPLRFLSRLHPGWGHLERFLCKVCLHKR